MVTGEINIAVFASVIMLVVGGHSFQIVTMKEWCGEDSLRRDLLENPVPLVVIQHTVTRECTTNEECEIMLKAIRYYHTKHLGLTDIGYNFMIGSNGKVYEGAGWSLVGAHTKGFNMKSLGIAFIGDFRETLPTPDALQAAQDLINYGLENGHLPGDYKLYGHRQLTSTISPGDALQKLIKTWPNWSSSTI